MYSPRAYVQASKRPSAAKMLQHPFVRKVDVEGVRQCAMLMACLIERAAFSACRSALAKLIVRQRKRERRSRRAGTPVQRSFERHVLMSPTPDLSGSRGVEGRRGAKSKCRRLPSRCGAV